jgi:nicotinamidase-related amidase
VAFPALSLRAAGHDVFVVADCCAGINAETHNLALDRLRAAGVRVTSWIQLLSEWEFDWTRTATYAGANGSGGAVVVFVHGLWLLPSRVGEWTAYTPATATADDVLSMTSQLVGALAARHLA